MIAINWLLMKPETQIKQLNPNHGIWQTWQYKRKTNLEIKIRLKNRGFISCCQGSRWTWYPKSYFATTILPPHWCCQPLDDGSLGFNGDKLLSLARRKTLDHLKAPLSSILQTARKKTDISDLIGLVLGPSYNRPSRFDYSHEETRETCTRQSCPRRTRSTARNILMIPRKINPKKFPKNLFKIKLPIYLK